MEKKKLRIAVLDDYQNVAKQTADWSAIEDASDLVVFNDHLFEESQLVERLKSFDVVCVMRERTPLTPSLLRKLQNLKLIVSTGTRNASIDLKSAEQLGIEVAHTGYVNSGATEHTWAMLMAIARHLPEETQSFKNGEWQKTVGTDLKGKTIGILGLGNIGKKIAVIAKVFEMKVIAWSENLTPEICEPLGVTYVDKKTLFKTSDFITIHMVLSDRSRGIVSGEDFNLMKSSAFFINTSRGPLVDESSLIDVLQNKGIAGAALDVFDIEPLPENHPFRTLDNVLATSHIGFVTEDTYKVFYEDTVRILKDWLLKN
jgi:phosphoglycerate dehydrogenase-like enzyme